MDRSSWPTSYELQHSSKDDPRFPHKLQGLCDLIYVTWYLRYVVQQVPKLQFRKFSCPLAQGTSAPTGTFIPGKKHGDFLDGPLQFLHMGRCRE